MAQINTTFGFKDQITQSLSLLNNTLTSMNKTLATMQGQMSGVNSGMSNVEKSAQKTADKVGGLSTKMLNFNMAVQAFHAIKGAIDSVGQSISECSSLYNFQIAQETKLESVMRNRMKAGSESIQMIKDFASEQQKLGVIGDEVQLAGAQELATYLDNAENLKTLLPMLNDLAVQASGDGNVSAGLETSLAQMVGKVMEGNLSGMSRRGWHFTDEEKQAFTQMNEAQRAQFLANYARNAIGNQNVDFAKSAQGQMIQMKNRIGDMKEEVGRAIIPFVKLKTLITSNWQVRWYQTVINALNFIQRHTKEVVAVFAGLSVAILGTATAFAVMKAAAIKTAIATAVAFLPVVAIIALVGALIATLLVFSSITFPAINGFVGAIIESVKEMGYQIKSNFGTLIETIGNGFLSLNKMLLDTMYPVFDFLLKGIKVVARGIDFVFHTSLSSDISNFRNNLNVLRNQKDLEFSLGWKDNRRGYGNAWSEGWENGQQKGREYDNQLKSVLNMVQSFPDKISGNLDKLSFGSDGSLKTSDSSLVDIADDYKELLSARARERFNLKFSQMTPEVNIGDVVVTGEADEDRLMNKIVNSIVEVCSAYTRESA